MPRLGVNVDHVATVRQARGTVEPDPVTAAALAELAGAGGITVHLREDRRHIQDRDVDVLRQTVRTRLNLEMAATEEMVAIALRTRPDCVTLVPERRAELTTEGGLDVVGQRGLLENPVRRLREAGIFVSLFVDPDLAQVETAQELGADAIEIHTGTYCDAKNTQTRQSELVKIEQAVRLGQQLGLIVHAGHGLNYQNVRPVVALGGIEEFNIGHSIISRAVLVGMDQAVREMLALIEGR
ncbi:pyridoxine 5'-phosphate synthase [Geoalkalibacter ferrihydriticus DSM 17813]|uniref:Pyridoxine 5'-phosphate synthase n=1 Tax=Geoalkalibacter ferrihydriticus DSM 17813 TaxID=1121915 RepID=A0A0C2EF20_9BACT|nr:pyridoxine 5'-phosphate synthase [Geoalkalibacter ferrihydriticus DSM 17813]